MLEWNESYSTGDTHLDEQHHFIFEFANNMEEVIREGRGISFMKESFSVLEDYVTIHFGLEADCMHQRHSAVAAANDSDHERFAAKVAQYKARIETFGITDAIVLDVHRYLELWLKQHILGIDVQLRSAAP